MARNLAIRLPAGAQARGVFWITCSITAFTCFMVVGRHVTQTLHPFEALFLRSIFMLILMAPWAIKHGLGPFTRRRMGPFALRGVLAMANMTLLLSALALMPVAEVSAINFLRPMLTTLLAVLFLSEVVNVQRWVAVAVGFVGAMIIIRPGFVEVNWGVALALCSCVTAAITFILVKTLTGRETPDTIAFFQPVFVLPLSAVLTVFVWQVPSWSEIGWCAVLGCFSITTHRTMNRAFAAVELSFLQPLDFIRLPIAAVLGWFAFGDTTDIYTWIGGTVIFFASIYGTKARAG